MLIRKRSTLDVVERAVDEVLPEEEDATGTQLDRVADQFGPRMSSTASSNRSSVSTPKPRGRRMGAVSGSMSFCGRLMSNGWWKLRPV